MRTAPWIAGTIAAGACLGALLVPTGQAASAGQFAIPAEATALEGLPRVRVVASQDRVIRLELGAAETARHRLRIAVKDGRYYWATNGDLPLVATTAGEFIYLSSSEPGQYVRIRRLGDRLSYVEHLDIGGGNVTYWGEMRIVLGK